MASLFDEEPERRAVQLVAFADDGTCRVPEEAAKLLRDMPGPLRVVSVVGPYRSGKSYLLNHLAGGDRFSCSDSVQSCTKGLWVYPAGPSLLLVDTEGIGAHQGSTPEHDCRVFALAVMCASHLVFNCRGAIDSDNIGALNIVAQLAAELGLDGTMFPALMWLVRDFRLDLRDRGGGAISADQYLEEALEGEAAEELKGLFRERRCVTAPPLPTSRRARKPFEDALDAVARVVEGGEYIGVRGAGTALGGKAFLALVEQAAEGLNNKRVQPAGVWRLIKKTQDLEANVQVLAAVTAALERGDVAAVTAEAPGWLAGPARDEIRRLLVGFCDDRIEDPAVLPLLDLAWGGGRHQRVGGQRASVQQLEATVAGQQRENMELKAALAEARTARPAAPAGEADAPTEAALAAIAASKRAAKDADVEWGVLYV